MSPSKTLFFLCLSFIAGIFLESAVKIPQIFVFGFLLLGILLVFISFLSTKPGIIAGFCVLFFVIGILRVQISEFNIENDPLAKLNGKGAVVLNGVIVDEPDVRDASQKLKIKVGDSIVLASAQRYPEYGYLDKVKVTGKPEAPSVTDEFNYKNYLLKDHIYSVINFAKIEKTGKAKQNFFTEFYSGVLAFKGKLDDSIKQNFSPPESLLLQGIILGNNKNMTADLRDGLNATGLRFLTAISGVHVIILSNILLAVFLFFNFYKKQALCFSIIFVWLYIVLTGMSASGIRAGIMGSIFLMAQVLGRQNTSSRTIVLAGSLMLLQNPLLLFYDIGFQLSFMASAGIMHLKPLIDMILKFVLRGRLGRFADIVSVTLTAQIFTLPIMIFNFGGVSLIAPITNILIIPVFYWILFFGFLFSILGTFSNILGLVFSVPCRVLILYFIKVLNIFNQPWAVKTIPNFSFAWIFVFYIAAGFGIWLLNKNSPSY